jgi:putative ABC transport system substrate-binding protein
MIRRREFIRLLGGAAAWPFETRAQQESKPIVGILAAPAPEPLRDQIAAFRQGMIQLGYVEGENVLIEYRWAEGHYERLAEMANDLVARRANVIVGGCS